VSEAATLTWFASHEFRLAWRDWLSMMTAGRRSRERVITVVLVVFIAMMHLFAWSMVRRVATMGTPPDKAALVAVTGSLLLSFSLMLSQAMESVTRAFYARADLELILSSPVEVKHVFAVRIGALSVSTTLLGLVLAAPFINMLAWCSGARWLAAYGVVAAMGLIAAAMAVALTVALFRTIGRSARGWWRRSWRR
jgi:ABC-2 type transport system permease protein